MVTYRSWYKETNDNKTEITEAMGLLLLKIVIYLKVMVIMYIQLILMHSRK